MRTINNVTIERLRDRVRDAQKELNNAMQEAFPVGSRVTWLHNGKHRQYGVVDHVSDCWWSDPLIRCQNDRTGKVVDVHLWMEPEKV